LAVKLFPQQNSPENNLNITKERNYTPEKKSKIHFRNTSQRTIFDLGAKKAKMPAQTGGHFSLTSTHQSPVTATAQSGPQPEPKSSLAAPKAVSLAQADS
jgi:hypothetical protein